jgi:hypothetical protein
MTATPPAPIRPHKMTHRWINNTCIECNLKREKRPLKRAIFTCIDDIKAYSVNDEWWYGDRFGFKRPECVSTFILKKRGIKIGVLITMLIIFYNQM